MSEETTAALAEAIMGVTIGFVVCAVLLTGLWLFFGVILP